MEKQCDDFVAIGDEPHGASILDCERNGFSLVSSHSCRRYEGKRGTASPRRRRSARVVASQYDSVPIFGRLERREDDSLPLERTLEGSKPEFRGLPKPGGARREKEIFPQRGKCGAILDVP